MKKFLSFLITAMVLSLAVIPQGALAIIEPEMYDFALSAQNDVPYSSVGDEVTIPLNLSSLRDSLPCDLLSLKTTVEYDSSVLQYVSTDAGPILKNASKYFNVTPENGRVSLIFMDEDLGHNAITSQGIFASLKFKVIKDIPTRRSVIHISDIAASNKKIGSLHNWACFDGSVTKAIPATDLTLTVEKTYFSNEGDIITVPVKLSGIPSNGLTGVETTIKYDYQVLEYISADPGQIIKNASDNFSVNQESGSITLLFTDEELSSNNAITSAGIFANLKFKVLPSATVFGSHILIDNLVMSDGDIKEVPANAVDGLISYRQEPVELITPSKVVFDINNPTDAAITIAKEKTLEDIKAGSASLIKGVDYTVSGNTVIIKKSYFQYFFGKWPKATNTLTFVVNSGKTATLTTTATQTTVTVILGDVNDDGNVDIFDATLVKAVVLKKKPESALKKPKNADMDGKDGITGLDYLLLKKKIQEKNSK